MDKLTSVHVGLMGHIDHGKTELARALSEKISTAGLDKHPQSKERGITIDLGFTMFSLNDYLVTLVDAPGHADLIRSVVASSSIIDAAIIAVAADEGPKIQTGEHLVVLKSMGIESIVVAITKMDLVKQKKPSIVEEKTKAIVDDVGFKNVKYVDTSALRNEGFESLRDALIDIIKLKPRESAGTFLMPIDHAFPVKGHGTVVTGTILRGEISVGETIELVPLGKTSKVRSIQTYSEGRMEASAGDRIGVNIPEIDDKEISRGDYLSASDSLQKTRNLLVEIETNPLYQDRITKKMVLSATIGMPSVTAEILPLELEGNHRIVLPDCTAKRFQAVLLLQRTVAVEPGMRVLLMRTDLPHTSMRIIGAGQVIKSLEHVTLYNRKTRIGNVSRVRETDVLVEGLASSKSVAETLKDAQVKTESGISGRLKQPFGTRGVLTATFESPVKMNESVLHERLVAEEYKYGY
ncbi:MAG: selenocysteine-specific translation elongation factor [Candidatus Thorarchaeota archaeon]